MKCMILDRILDGKNRTRNRSHYWDHWGKFDYEACIGINIVSMLNFLCVIMTSWIGRRMPLLLGDTSYIFKGGVT